MPKTLTEALNCREHALVITEKMAPFRITHVNQSWCTLCGYDADEAIGQKLKMLQGPGTCQATLRFVHKSAETCTSITVRLLNYTKVCSTLRPQPAPAAPCYTSITPLSVLTQSNSSPLTPSFTPLPSYSFAPTFRVVTDPAGWPPIHEHAAHGSAGRGGCRTYSFDGLDACSLSRHEQAPERRCFFARLTAEPTSSTPAAATATAATVASATFSNRWIGGDRPDHVARPSQQRRHPSRPGSANSPDSCPAAEAPPPGLAVCSRCDTINPYPAGSIVSWICRVTGGAAEP